MLRFNSFSNFKIATKLWIGSLFLTCGLTVQACAIDLPVKVSKVELSAITPVSTTAAVYLTLSNNGESKLALVDVETKVAHHAMFHLSKNENGVAKMSHQDEVVIKGKQKIEFRRGGLHIMLMGINKELISKEFEIVLKFASGEELPFKVNQGK